VDYIMTESRSVNLGQDSECELLSVLRSDWDWKEHTH
jgi:hypothetical protein